MAGDSSLTKAGEQPEISFRDLVESSRVIAETASDAIITINENSKILFVNRAAVDIFGHSREEMLAGELTMLMPEYLRHLHRAGLKQYVETGQKHISWDAVELPGLHKNGKEIALELSFGEFRKGGQRFFTGIARDITKRKQDERRLALQHSVAEILAASSSVADAAPKLLEAVCRNLNWQFAAFWSVFTDTNELRVIAHWQQELSAGLPEFISASLGARFSSELGFPGKIWASKQPIWVEDFGADPTFPRSPIAARENLRTAFGFPIMFGKQVLGVVELFSRELKEAHPATIDTLVAIGSQIGQFIERKKGEAELINALARAHEARLEAEAVTRQLEALQKMTDAALAHLSIEQVLSQSLSRIREVLNVDTVAILLLEAEGEELVAWAAQGLEEEVKLGVRIPIGRGFAGKVIAEARPIIIDDVSKADVYNPLLRQKGIKSLLGVPLLVEGRRTGVLHVGKLEIARFTDEDVRLLELAADRIALAIENARLYQVEKAARAEAEAANRAKDEFLTILSHELRTPLTPIIGWVHMMQNGILADADFTKVLAVINRNAYNLKRLINDLLDMSAILSGKMRIEEASVAIAGVLEESVETMRAFARSSKVHLRLNIVEDAKLLTIKGDRSRLNQAFCNVIHNAIKFSPAGGYVQVSGDSNDAEFVIRIKDQGEGIPADFLPHVFERFRQVDSSRTRAYGGLGLGLALVQSFVEAHHGRVKAASQGEGKGSVFTITLPLEVATQDKDTGLEHKPDIEVGNARTRVLVVEDQPDTLEMLASHFQTRGYDVLTCDSAAKALQIAERDRFDILISDIAMPSMDGLQLIAKLRQREDLKNLPAIALTGYASQNDVDAALAAGFDLHLSKPVDPAELAASVQKLLLSHAGRTADPAE